MSRIVGLSIQTAMVEWRWNKTQGNRDATNRPSSPLTHDSSHPRITRASLIWLNEFALLTVQQKEMHFQTKIRWQLLFECIHVFCAICEARYRKLAFKCKVMVVVCVDIDASLSHIGFFDKLWIMQWWLLLLSFFLRVYFSQSATWARKRIVEPRVRVLKRHPIISIVWPNVLQCSLWKLPIQTSMPMTYNQLTMQELKLLRNRNKYVKFLCVHSADRQRSWKWAKKLFNYKKIRLWWVHFSYNSILGVNLHSNFTGSWSGKVSSQFDQNQSTDIRYGLETWYPSQNWGK